MGVFIIPELINLVIRSVFREVSKPACGRNHEVYLQSFAVTCCAAHTAIVV